MFIPKWPIIIPTSKSNYLHWNFLYTIYLLIIYYKKKYICLNHSLEKQPEYKGNRKYNFGDSV